MINTTCENCIFAKYGDKDCFFDIPLILKDIKNIYIKNNANYIENYSCRYCLSRRVYEETPELQQINIAQYVVEKAKIKYYLIFNITNHINKIPLVCDIINKLDIKPQYISFINQNRGKVKDTADEINSNMPVGIRWKLHNFVMDLSLQECMTIAMDTNIDGTDAKIFVVYDPIDLSSEDNTLNDRINFIHLESMVKQTNFQAVINTFDNIDGLSISWSAFKFLILNIDGNILEAIKKESDFVYIKYENE